MPFPFDNVDEEEIIEEEYIDEELIEEDKTVYEEVGDDVTALEQRLAAKAEELKNLQGA